MWRLCYYDENGVVWKDLIYLLGYLIDLVGFLLLVVVYMMIFCIEDIENGVYYFGFGVEDENFLVLYYWFFFVICYFDYDYE